MKKTKERRKRSKRKRMKRKRKAFDGSEWMLMMLQLMMMWTSTYTSSSATAARSESRWRAEVFWAPRCACQSAPGSRCCPTSQCAGGCPPHTPTSRHACGWWCGTGQTSLCPAPVWRHEILTTVLTSDTFYSRHVSVLYIYYKQLCLKLMD